MITDELPFKSDEKVNARDTSAKSIRTGKIFIKRPYLWKINIII